MITKYLTLFILFKELASSITKSTLQRSVVKTLQQNTLTGNAIKANQNSLDEGRLSRQNTISYFLV